MKRWNFVGDQGDHATPNNCCWRCALPVQAVRMLIWQDGKWYCTDCVPHIPTSIKEKYANMPNPPADGRYAQFGGRTRR